MNSTTGDSNVSSVPITITIGVFSMTIHLPILSMSSVSGQTSLQASGSPPIQTTTYSQESLTIQGSGQEQTTLIPSSSTTKGSSSPKRKISAKVKGHKTKATSTGTSTTIPMPKLKHNNPS